MDTSLKHRVAFGLALMGMLLLSSGTAQAKIVKLLKKRKIVAIDDRRVKKGDRVCFYKKKTKRACGRVVKVSTKKKRSYVRIAKRSSFRKLEKGMMHEVVGAGSSVASRSSGASLFKLRTSFQPSYNRRTKYKISNLDETNSAGATFVESENKPEPEGIGAILYDWTAHQSWLGVGVEFDALVYQNISVAAGARYVWIAPATSSSSPGTELMPDKDGVATGMKASEHEFSAWLDCYPYEIPTALVRLGLGIEGNYNMLLVSGTILDCSGELCKGTAAPKVLGDKEIYKANSNLITMSFRLTARRDFKITDYFGLGASLRGIVTPFSITSPTTTVTEPDKTLLGMFDGDKKKIEKALNESLDYKHGIYSVMIELSAFFSF